MAMLRTLIMSLAMILKLGIAANYNVGGPNGMWDATTDLQTWAASQSFVVGDNLSFHYGPMHDVLEVSKAGYDSCQTSSPIQSYIGGTTVIPLSSPGKRYFTCGTPGHCVAGMKLEIDTLANSTPPPASPLIPPASPSLPSPPTPLTQPPAAPGLPLPPASLTQPPASMISPPVSSPAPKISDFLPPQSPELTAPTMSPLSHTTSLFTSPASSPTASLLPSGSVLPPPSPSSANKYNLHTSFTIGISLIMLIFCSL